MYVMCVCNVSGCTNCVQTVYICRYVCSMHVHVCSMHVHVCSMHVHVCMYVVCMYMYVCRYVCVCVY